MKGRTGWVPVTAAVAALLCALGLAYEWSRALGESDYLENVAALRQLKQLDARWELDVLKSRIGINVHYDPLAASQSGIASGARALGAALGAGRHDDTAELRAGLDRLNAAIVRKIALVERFKSGNSVLRNSMVFLPTAADDAQQALLGERATVARRLAVELNEVLLASLLYSNGATEERGAETLARLASVESVAKPLSAPTVERIDIFAAHVRTVIREQRGVDALLAEIAAVDTAASIDEIGNRLGREQRRAEERNREYREYLLVFAAVLLAAMLYLAVQLTRSHAVINRVNRELQVANGSLEQRVQERTREVEDRTAELTRANASLQGEIAEREQLQGQLVQSEKLASIGQLAAGVAHEINNPVGYVSSNFSSLEGYLANLFEVLAAYEAAEPAIGDGEIRGRLASLKSRVELDFLKDDIPSLMRESREGLTRVSKIVSDLKDFSHVDAQPEWHPTNLQQCIESTLNVVNNEVKYKADVAREYGILPEVECVASQISQVVMNLVVNAAHAIGPERGLITIRTGADLHNAWIEVADNGSGIPEASLARIFDPFYTTKPIGKGTGLGLSLSYGIVQKHNGNITVQTAVGRGTTFRVTLPIVQAGLAEAA